MIEHLREFYDSTAEIVVYYDPKQEELYKKASSELWKEADSWGLKHHSYELEKARDNIQRKYRKAGLEIPIFSLCKGTSRGGGNNNFAAMIVKHYFESKKFNVLVSSEDFALIFDRSTRTLTKGFSIISNIFGKDKVEELMKRASKNGGEPDLFVYLDSDPQKAWFVEAKSIKDSLKGIQIEHFSIIRDLLCPVEIARVVPSV